MHVGLIPDGNRRYMKKKGITSLSESYKRGITRFYDFLEWCAKYKVDEVTLYALSLENIQSRGDTEIRALFKVFAEEAEKGLDDERIHRNHIRVKVCGDRNLLKEKLEKASDARNLISNLEALEESTKDYKGLVLNLAIAYGGRQEIIESVKKTLADGLELSEENIGKNLWVESEPDIIIRTSEKRISNFLVWQSAYSEIYFLDKLWQEIEEEDLANIINEYTESERRFGK